MYNYFQMETMENVCSMRDGPFVELNVVPEHFFPQICFSDTWHDQCTRTEAGCSCTAGRAGTAGGRTLLYMLGTLLCSALLCIAGYVLGKHFKHYMIYIYKNIYSLAELMPDADSASSNNYLSNNSNYKLNYKLEYI